jgi:hypothetical protein
LDWNLRKLAAQSDFWRNISLTLFDPGCYAAANAIRCVQDLRYFKPKTLPDLICTANNNCDAENTFLGRLRMLAFNRLRIDPGNGSPTVDYRIENGFVESRILGRDATKRSTLAIEKQWQRLTPEQLTSRLMADTVLLRWLRHRMGVYRLIRACNQGSSSLFPNNPALKALIEPQRENRYLA